ncbi:dihydrofolate synthase / folylpolyglutamate synthase [Marinospirillum celere]|uniref:Dihydrofolate synthase/folylpolyglutamate synthase n=1 Tax=Marinospirillum celere TaxID=1122252 RepID=A0A1I1JH30_9GAMM|nr:bifunctional tetrahydrofolate synthase/dihydrofolate synthase [Marinospirillum celere]SFC44760.1 dihydrofolate synthase / folylpolyglutamate synthase [Marinospirillum celere]
MTTAATKKSSGSLAEWLKRLEDLHSREIDLGLDRVGEVARRLGLPLTLQATRPQVITFAGTNGKGSTLAMTQSMALAAGLRVGSYTSPHFLHFNERIQLQGQAVTDALIIGAFERIDAARNQADLTSISLSYFEFATLAALVIFAEADLDLWLLEVGLGGRLDAVNIVDADVAVVTTIALDHQEYLGNDLQQIGREKAGIFRAGQAAVLGSQNLPASVRATAETLGCKVFQLGTEFYQFPNQNSWCWQGQNAQGESLEITSLPWPELPRANAAAAVQALELTGLPITDQARIQGLAQARVTGRMQRQGAWLLDVAHNPQAAEYLATRLAEEPGKKRLAILGMMADKDQLATITPLLSCIDEWMVTALPTARAEQPLVLEQLIKKQGGKVVYCNASTQPEPLYAQARQRLDAGEMDQVLVVGSFFTVALFLDLLQRKEMPPCATA